MPVEAARGCLVVIAGSSFSAIHAGAPFSNVEVELEDALFAEDEFGDRHQGRFGALAQEGPAGSEEKIFDKLLGESGATPGAAARAAVACSTDNSWLNSATMAAE